MNQDTSARSTDDRDLEQSDEPIEVRRIDIVRELHELMHSASVDELRAARMILCRFMGKGRASYGPLDIARDPRNFKDERAEEKADAFFYDVLEELRQYDERQERRKCEVADAVAALEIEPERISNGDVPVDDFPEPLPPAPIVSGPHTIADFDLSDSDEEPTR